GEQSRAEPSRRGRWLPLFLSLSLSLSLSLDGWMHFPLFLFSEPCSLNPHHFCLAVSVSHLSFLFLPHNLTLALFLVLSPCIPLTTPLFIFLFVNLSPISSFLES